MDEHAGPIARRAVRAGTSTFQALRLRQPIPQLDRGALSSGATVWYQPIKVYESLGPLIYTISRFFFSFDRFCLSQQEVRRRQGFPEVVQVGQHRKHSPRVVFPPSVSKSVLGVLFRFRGLQSVLSSGSSLAPSSSNVSRPLWDGFGPLLRLPLVFGPQSFACSSCRAFFGFRLSFCFSGFFQSDLVSAFLDFSSFAAARGFVLSDLEVPGQLHRWLVFGLLIGTDLDLISLNHQSFVVLPIPPMGSFVESTFTNFPHQRGFPSSSP